MSFGQRKDIITDVKLEQYFDKIFNDRDVIPLFVNKYLLKKYTAHVKTINKNTLNTKKHPELLTLTQKYDVNFTNIKRIYLSDLPSKLVYFMLNSIRFGDTNKRRKRLYQYLGLSQYVSNYTNSYSGENNYDTRIYYRFINEHNFEYKASYILNNLEHPKMRFYLENLYYINKLDTDSICVYISDDRRKQALKNTKVTSELSEDQLRRYDKFVNMAKFIELTNIIEHVVGRYYITGSIIDYINSTTFNEDNYTDSDIDILVTDKLKFQLLAGYLTKLNEPNNDAIEYTGNRINIKADVYSYRPIQIYYCPEKQTVFSHHFPCVRGYINAKGSMALSHQAIDIFRPDSNKIVKFVFMFPYTNMEKSKAIIKKYHKRGYIVKGIDYVRL